MMEEKNTNPSHTGGKKHTNLKHDGGKAHRPKTPEEKITQT